MNTPPKSDLNTSYVDALPELTDEELDAVVGGDWIDDVIKIVSAVEPLVIPLIS